MPDPSVRKRTDQGDQIARPAPAFCPADDATAPHNAAAFGVTAVAAAPENPTRQVPGQMTPPLGCAVIASSRAKTLARSSTVHEPPAQAVGLVNTVRLSQQATATPSATLSVDLVPSFLVRAVASGTGWVCDQRCGIAAPSKSLTIGSPLVLRAYPGGVRMVMVRAPVAERRARRSATPGWVRLASDSPCRLPHLRPWARPGMPLLDQPFRPNRAAVARPATTPARTTQSAPQAGCRDGRPQRHQDSVRAHCDVARVKSRAQTSLCEWQARHPAPPDRAETAS